MKGILNRRLLALAAIALAALACLVAPSWAEGPAGVSNTSSPLKVYYFWGDG